MRRYTITIIGLGLMGGSLSYALRGFKDCLLIGVDNDSSVLKQAESCGAVDIVCGDTAEAISQSDLTIFCTFPSHILKSFEDYAGFFRKNSVVTEICGVKRDISLTALRMLPPEIDYVGIHPMAGKEISGFANAEAAIFANTGFLITRTEKTRDESVSLMTGMARHIGATRIAVTDAKGHDDIIGWSSDLMHIASAALCVSYPEAVTRAYTAGAFRDCTRIANINPALWSELLLENGDSILPHLDNYIENLSSMRLSIENHDKERLYALLDKARANKKELDSR